MPQKVICEECGKILYSNMEPKPPVDIIKTLDGKCPQCGKTLVFDSKKIEFHAL
jgi:ribosomal protein S27E